MTIDLVRVSSEERTRRETLVAAGATPKEAERIMYASWQYQDVEPTKAVALYRADVAQHRAQRLRALRAALLAQGTPERHLVNVFDNAPDESEAMRAADEWLDSRQTFLVLLGGVGVGKSAAAAWALVEDLGIDPDSGHSHTEFLPRDEELDRAAPARGRGGKPGRYLAASELSRLSGFDATKEWDAVSKAPFLVLDDVGAEYADAKGWSTSAIHKLLCERYDGNRRTVITSNLTAEGFKQHLGERVADRIRESGRVVVLAGKSRRPELAKRLGPLPPMRALTEGCDDAFERDDKPVRR